jgi:hypothetical protein
VKKIFLVVLFLVCSAVVFADPYSGQGSSWKCKNDTVVISSGTPTLIDACSGGYRVIYLGDPNVTTTVYYTLDQSSTTLTTTGMWFNPSNVYSIESNNKIYLQLPDGSSSVTLRRMISTK